MTDKLLEYNRPEKILVYKSNHKWTLIDVGVPCVNNIVKAEKAKIQC